MIAEDRYSKRKRFIEVLDGLKDISAKIKVKKNLKIFFNFIIIAAFTIKFRKHWSSMIRLNLLLSLGQKAGKDLF